MKITCTQPGVFNVNGEDVDENVLDSLRPFIDDLKPGDEIVVSVAHWAPMKRPERDYRPEYQA